MTAAVPHKVVKVSKDWTFRLIGNMLVIAFIALVAFIILIWQNEWISQQTNFIANKVNQYTLKMGFNVEDIIISGREKLSKEEVQNAVNVTRADNLLFVDIYKIKENLEQLPWVQDVMVKKTYFPNVLQIAIVEKKVLALWQYKGRFYPLDYNAEVIEATYVPQTMPLIVIGEDAPQKLLAFLEQISANKALFERVKAVSYISKRRWNVTLDHPQNGIVIKLPEQNVKSAWKKLIEISKTQNILKRKLTIIDLRLPDRVVVKLDRKNSVKPKKTKEISG